MIEGKTIFNWNVPQIFEGDPYKFTKILVDGGFEGILLKAAEGNAVFRMSSYGPWPTWGENIRQELITTLRKAGIKIYLWHFPYGIDPKGEVEVAVKQCDKFHPDGYVWDVEGPFDNRANAVSNARVITKGLQQAFPMLPQALCWWAFPLNPSRPSQQWHPLDVGKAFLEVCQYGMPMMYWGGETTTDATSYLERSLGIWRGFTNRPILPIGRAFNGTGGVMNDRAITAFANMTMSLKDHFNLPGISWWSLDKVLNDPGCWKAISLTPKYGETDPEPPNPPELTDQEKLNRLVAAHPDLFPELA